MRISPVARLAVLFAALGCSPLALAQPVPASPDAMHGGPHAMYEPVPEESMKTSRGAARAPFDLQFLDTMSAHAQAAVEMAQLAEQRAGHAELKKLAKKMIDGRQADIKQLQAWRKQWYEGRNEAVNTKLPGVAASMKGMSLDRLEASDGDAFDARFIDMLSRHHDGAIRMARAAAKKANHPELKTLAAGIATVRQEERAQMAQWKKDWALAAPGR